MPARRREKRQVISGYDLATVLALALVVDALVGEPAALYARAPHPVVLLGRLALALEARLRRPEAEPTRQRGAGVLLLAVMVAGSLAVGWLVQGLLLALPFGRVWLALAASSLLAQRSLVDHVRAVAQGLELGLAAGRAAVARIVGRDPETLDRHGVARAAVESLAENLSDGVVAPAFWFLVGGLPGLLAYKAVSTLDSMVGHQDARYRHFGWASARLDDLANLIPARVTAALLLVAGRGPRRAAIIADWRLVRRDAGHHRSPNAGWPEAAMAHLLGVRLGGPRVYGGVRVEDVWLGEGSPDLAPEEIERALRLAWRAWAVLLGAVVLLALLG